MGDVAIFLRNVSKFYKLYDSPKQRLIEALHPFGKKYHKEFYAIKNLDLEVKKGEILGIIGRNGSGKSTLLKLISSILVPSSGTVAVQGSISALIELGAGFNPQFTGLDNIYFYGTILGFTREEMDARIDAIIAFADIGDFIHQPIKTYSSGMKARLGFAVATEVDPDILIVDEVLAVGDTVFQRKCFGKINNMFKDGKTVILVSHSRNSIIGLCENAILLDKGEMLCSGDAEPVVKEYEKLCYKQFLLSNKKEGSDQTTEQKKSEGSKAESNDAIEEDEVAWDPTLDSGDPVVYRKSEIDFESFGIYDMKDNKVNILKPGFTYKIKATFMPHQELNDDVMFALRITTLQGYKISWMGYPFKKNEYLDIHKDSLLEIEFLFDCNFGQGVFCIDAGLQSVINNDLYIHSSMGNVYTFKLNADPKRNLIGDVHLNFRTFA